ncbi:MAG: protein translocase subunit SecD, partial [Lachnospiraceae bacterium]|nr:protein translocase subunit SecD [Lachnospiraceae bacterium]
PYVNSPIEDGKAIISGMESFEDADNLATQIRIGGLSLELQEIRSQVVGAQLGAEAIESSLKAGVIGLALVIIFMLVAYLLPGVVASIALFIYIALMVIMLDSFSITLTLSGIAGIILSIGMAVDANVIIFSRIKEELATGKTVQSAIKQGFNKALSAIVDGNITTLIAAAVLGFAGTGSVKGFAQTLALGIVLSMFTALVVTRGIMAVMYALGFQDEKFYGVAKERKSIQFVQKRKIWFAISGVMIASGIIAMIFFNTNGKGALNYSMEFIGGTSTTVEFSEEYDLSYIEENVIPKITDVIGDNEVQTTMVKDSKEVIFKTKTLDENTRLSLDKMFEADFGVSVKESESISATVSNEMRSDAIMAIAVATVLMLIYIAFRFSDIRFGASSIIALIHDVLVVLAFYAIARISVGNNFIACMLTIVGYSINATIVIFDRIRENLKEMTRASMEEIVNKSITQSLSRSIFTSLTTFFMVAALCIFGATSLVEFAMPLMVGIICGTFSSICLTGPIWYLLRKYFVKKESED